MSDQPRTAESIFGEAIDIQSADDRAAFLEQACGGDPQLRAGVEKLVADHFRAGSFLEEPLLHGGATTAMRPGPEREGSHIGPYKLRERLGEGGMGVVWAAEQKQPLRRKVALKVIKPGMDTSAVIARFDAEREALSLMDHPNVARVLDAGTTEQGRPYFVMELIRGVPITYYCDAHMLTIRERLGLFTHVCRAVQHAHQKGIIHRDIKPSNVLVTEQDGQPVPKVIDFGVAKALHQPLTDLSVYTGVFQAVGTLAYMSPEQAALSATDVDTRADVYGLGVLLYELLTGSTPFDRKQLESAAIDEACRIIREEDPPTPSTRISTLGEQSVTVSKSRRTDAMGLCKSVRGDLDWIAMKALAKDRGNRYATPTSLAEDVAHFLNDEEVTARAPSATYRLYKFVRRNRTAVTILALVILLLTVTGAFGWISYVGSIALRAAEKEKQIPLLLVSAQQKHRGQDYEGAAEQYRSVIDLEREILGPGHVDTARHMVLFAQCLGEMGDISQANTLFKEALDRLVEAADVDDAEIREVAETYRIFLVDSINRMLSNLDAKAASLDAAQQYAENIRWVTRRYSLRPTSSSILALADTAYVNGRFDVAEAACQEWLSLFSTDDGIHAYLVLSAVAVSRGDVNTAADWLSATNCVWMTMHDTWGFEEKLRTSVENSITANNVDVPKDLSVEERERLYSKILMLAPKARAARRYRGYCLFQLGRWDEASEQFRWVTPTADSDAYEVGCIVLMSLYFDQTESIPFTAQGLKQLADSQAGHTLGMMAIATMLYDQKCALDYDAWYPAVGGANSVAGSLGLYRKGKYDAAIKHAQNHGGVFPARDALNEVIMALCYWELGTIQEARDAISRAEELIDRLSPLRNRSRTNTNVGFFTSVVWLEPLLLLREARKKIPRAPGEVSRPIDASLYPNELDEADASTDVSAELTFSPDKDLLAAAECSNGTVASHNVRDARIEKSHELKAARVTGGMALFPDGSWLKTVGL